jgi:O-antigen/teichoic acid export membrane protein
VASIKKNFIYNVILSISQILFPLITFPYASRVLNPGGLGIVSFADSFTQYFILLAALGIPVYGVREIAKVKDEPAKLSTLFSELLIINVIATVFCLLLYIGLIFSVNKLHENQSVFFVGCGILLSNVFLIEWLFIGLENFQYMVKRTVAFRFLTMCLIFIIVTSPEDKTYYYGITFLFYILSALANMRYAQKFVTISFSGIQFRKHLKPLFFIFSTTIVISMYAILDNIILGFLTDETYVGYYTVSMRISKFSIALVGALGLVLIPRLSALFQNDNTLEALKLLNKSVQYVIIFSVPISLGILLMADDLIMLFSGKAYMPAITSLRIFALIVIIIGFAQIYSQQILIPLNKEIFIFRSVLLGVVISLTLNFLLIPIYKHNGAAISNLITELIVTISLYYYSRKFFPIAFPIKAFFFSILSCSLFYPIRFLADVIELNYIYKLILVTVFSGITYFLFQLYLFKNVFIKEYLHTIVQKVFNSQRGKHI